MHRRLCRTALMRMIYIYIQRLLLPTLDHTPFFFFFWNSAKCDPAGSEKHIFKLVWPNSHWLHTQWCQNASETFRVQNFLGPHPLYRWPWEFQWLQCVIPSKISHPLATFTALSPPGPCLILLNILFLWLALPQDRISGT